MLIGWKIGSCSGHGGHEIESRCWVGVSEIAQASGRTPDAPFLLGTFVTGPHGAGGLFGAGEAAD